LSVVAERFLGSPTTGSSKPYIAKRLTGDGTVLSLDGENNIMCSDLDFHVAFNVDYVQNPVSGLPSGSGVIF